MKYNNPRTPGAFGRPAAWGSALALAAAFLMGSSSAFAAAPAANASISNQASASYLDTNGNAQVSSSNVVSTTVQQVGSFTLDAKTTTASPYDIVTTKSGAAGAVIYAPHVLTNTGNGSDGFNISVAGSTKFSKVEIYTDTNSDGLPDSATPLCTSTGAGCTVPTAQTVAGSNGQFGFVVAYTIPATATTTGAYDIGNVTVTPITASTSMYGTANQTVTVQDSISLTNSAAFNVSLSIAQPSSGINPPSGSWPTAVNNGKRSSSPSCATTWSSTLASSSSCVYTTYTITYSNTGGASGRFNLKDVIGSGVTAGLTYVTGSAVWSNQSGVALAETASAAANTTVGVDFVYDSTSKALTFVDNALPVSTTRTLSFVVLVNSTALVGTTSTTSTATYNPADATGATASAPVLVTASSSNASAFTVNGTYSIVVGAAASAAASDAKDTTAGTPLTATTDTQTVVKVAAGKPATFTHKVYNLGNDADSVNISVASNTFPSGTIFRFYKADGTTELSDTNNDGTVDTGSIASGSSVQIVVKATVPTTTAANSTGYNLVLKGVSGSDSTQIDASADVLSAVTGPYVDLTNTAAGTSSGTSADLGTGPSTAATVSNASVPAGSWTTFSLFVTNNDSIDNAYALSASSTTGFPGSLPSGWTVKFVSGAVTSSSCSASAEITSTSTVTAGTQSQVTACIYVPATQVAVTQAVYFQAKSNSVGSDGSTGVDVIYDQVVVIAAASTYGSTLTPNGTGQVAPGGSVVYAHTLKATGTGSCQAGTVTVTLPTADVTSGWTYALYRDVNGDGQLDSGDALITDGSIPAVTSSAPVYLLVKVFAPGGAIAGATDIATVAVTFPAGTDNCGTPSATDTSTVVVGQIRLYASQAKNSACDSAGITTALSNLTSNVISAKPGECIVYQLKAVNEGTSVLSNLNLSDVVPSYTTLTTVQPTTTCASTSVSPAFANPTGWSSSTTALSCGNGTTTTTVQPGGTATLTFQVQINTN